VIDALDEAEAYRGGRTIAGLLGRLLAQPFPVRILASTRPDSRVLDYLPDGGFPHLDLIDDELPGNQDLRTYVAARLAGLPEERRDRLTDQIALAARGNFLIAGEALREVEKNPGVEPRSFPQSLGAYYHRFLRREIGRSWHRVFKPLLGVLAFARGEGLDVDQLQAISGLADVAGPLEVCGQYLEGELSNGPFRPYHKAFADFPVGEGGGQHRYRINPADMHRRIVRAYRRPRPRLALDAYASRHLSSHVLGAGDVAELWALVEDRSWYQFQAEQAPSGRAYLDDLELAWRAAEEATESRPGGARNAPPWTARRAVPWRSPARTASRRGRPPSSSGNWWRSAAGVPRTPWRQPSRLPTPGSGPRRSTRWWIACPKTSARWPCAPVSRRPKQSTG
jgi:hypothetical protein